uniref:Uncharacterized protein n=1 Tax=Cyclopterus lumpus TaxID=8103 RepID=A0A8C2ZC75_CYCLU
MGGWSRCAVLGAVPGAAPRRGRQLQHTDRNYYCCAVAREFRTLPSPDTTRSQGGRTEEGPVLPQKPIGWAYVGGKGSRGHLQVG